jgi:regulator of protease activity HflC (stomatin/prohibitin superfamily)
MTADDVTMDISLLYTYKVTDPVRYQLEVLDPQAIVDGFVEGTLRDVVNTRKMDEIMHSRDKINQEVMAILTKKEQQYGVKFILVQIQSASPPQEVLNAIKNRMVAEQLQEQADAEASQQRTLADSQFYTAQKKAEGEAYQVTKLAEAQAQALRVTLQELQDKGGFSRAVHPGLDRPGAPPEQQVDQVNVKETLLEDVSFILDGS